MATKWNHTVPYVVLKFETAALCADGSAKLTAPKRQQPRWAVEAVDAVRLKLAYDEPKTMHSFKLSVVDVYLGKGSCAVLGPTDADAAGVAPDALPATAGPAADTAVAPTADPEDWALAWQALQEPNSPSASGGPSAAVLMARALMLIEPSNEAAPKNAEYEFHERLGGGIAGRVVRVTDARGGVFAGKCARGKQDSYGLLQEVHQLLTAGTHPNLVKLVGVTLADAGKLCLLFPCASCTFQEYLETEGEGMQPLARVTGARDALAALLPAIAHVHARKVIHTDIKPANLLLERSPQGSFGGRRLLLADFSEAVVNDPACRRFLPPAEIQRTMCLRTTTPPNRAPEVHYGIAAWTELIDEWSAGTVALQTIRGTPWPMRADKPDMGAVFGTEAMRRVFGDAPLFEKLETSSRPSGAAPGAELDGDGRRVLQALLQPDPAKRERAADLALSNWFRERPVLNKTVAGRGGKGPFVIFEGFLGEEVLACRGAKSARTGHERAISVSFPLGVRNTQPLAGGGCFPLVHVPLCGLLAPGAGARGRGSGPGARARGPDPWPGARARARPWFLT